MASDHAPGVSRRRLLNFVIIAVAMLAVGVASVVASVLYANSASARQAATTGQLQAQARAQAATAKVQAATIAQLRRQQLTACNAAADLGTVPLPAKPPPSRFAVRIVTDNRAAWYGNGCGRPGSLPVPPGLAAAAARYGIPVNGKGS